MWVLGTLGLVGSLTILGCGDDDEAKTEGNVSAEGGAGGKPENGGKPGDAGGDEAGVAGAAPVESNGGAGGEATLPDPSGPTPGDADFEVIPVPEGASTGLPLAFNDRDDVLVGAAVDALEYNALFVVSGGRAEPVDTGDLDVALNGLNVAACITNEGKIGFNGQREGAHQAAFFNGVEVVDVSFGDADGRGLVLRGCNDAGTVVASTATGTEAWSWNDGEASLIVDDVFAVTLLGINQAGAVAFSSGLYDADELTTYPSSLLAAAGPSESGAVAGMMLSFESGTTTLATWKPGDDAATPIDPLPDASGVTAVAISDHGVVLAANAGSRKIRLWLSAGGAVTELAAAGYTLERVVDVNESGEILVAARADDETPISGLILRP